MNLCLKLFNTAFWVWMSEQLSRNLEEHKHKPSVAPQNFGVSPTWKKVIKKKKEMYSHPSPAHEGSQL